MIYFITWTGGDIWFKMTRKSKYQIYLMWFVEYSSWSCYDLCWHQNLQCSWVLISVVSCTKIGSKSSGLDLVTCICLKPIPLNILYMLHLERAGFLFIELLCELFRSIRQRKLCIMCYTPAEIFILPSRINRYIPFFCLWFFFCAFLGLSPQIAQMISTSEGPVHYK